MPQRLPPQGMCWGASHSAKAIPGHSAAVWVGPGRSQRSLVLLPARSGSWGSSPPDYGALLCAAMVGRQALPACRDTHPFRGPGQWASWATCVETPTGTTYQPAVARHAGSPARTVTGKNGVFRGRYAAEGVTFVGPQMPARRDLLSTASAPVLGAASVAWGDALPALRVHSAHGPGSRGGHSWVNGASTLHEPTGCSALLSGSTGRRPAVAWMGRLTIDPR